MHGTAEQNSSASDLSSTYQSQPLHQAESPLLPSSPILDESENMEAVAPAQTPGKIIITEKAYTFVMKLF